MPQMLQMFRRQQVVYSVYRVYTSIPGELYHTLSDEAPQALAACRHCGMQLLREDLPSHQHSCRQHMALLHKAARPTRRERRRGGKRPKELSPKGSRHLDPQKTTTTRRRDSMDTAAPTPPKVYPRTSFRSAQHFISHKVAALRLQGALVAT